MDRRRRVLSLAALCVAACFVLSTAGCEGDIASNVGGGSASSTGAKKGKNVVMKQGRLVEEKATKDTKKATKLQMGIGIGSIFVMIAVLKWL